MPGTVLQGIRAARQLASDSRICAPVAEGMAIMISPTVGLRRFSRRTTETASRPETEHRNAHDPCVLLQRIVIQEALDFVRREAVGVDFADQFGARGCRRRK